MHIYDIYDIMQYYIYQERKNITYNTKSFKFVCFERIIQEINKVLNNFFVTVVTL